MVTVSSSIAAQGKIDFEDLPAGRSYQWFASYARSKLANLMFALELDHRAKDGKDGPASRPGAARTPLYAATEAGLTDGEYIGPGGRAHLRGRRRK